MYRPLFELLISLFLSFLSRFVMQRHFVSSSATKTGKSIYALRSRLNVERSFVLITMHRRISPRSVISHVQRTLSLSNFEIIRTGIEVRSWMVFWGYVYVDSKVKTCQRAVNDVKSEKIEIVSCSKARRTFSLLFLFFQTCSRSSTQSSPCSFFFFSSSFSFCFLAFNGKWNEPASFNENSQ